MTTNMGCILKPPKQKASARKVLILSLNDVAGAYERALAAGAQVVVELQSQDYGGEGFTVRDPEGHIWSFGDYDPWV